MRLIHYSAEPLVKVDSKAQKPNSMRPFKPKGLWVSVEGEDDWPAWCKAEEFMQNRLAHSTEIVLKPGAKILHLSTAEEIKAFSKQHAFDVLEEMGHKSPLPRKWMMGVKWANVAQQYQGIVIAPYCYSVRMDDDAFWYYTWDCASGCIWDADAIAELRAIT